MNTKNSDTEPAWGAPQVKRGRKPLGQAAMSAAERKQRSRELGRARGAKEFLIKVEGLHLERIEALAKDQQISTASALRQVLEPALDRYAGVMKRCERMLENGVSEERVGEFLRDHLFPALPPIEESKVGEI